MKTFLRTALAALVVATAGVAASAPAQAGDIGFSLSIGGPNGGIVIRDGNHRGWNRFEDHRGRDRFNDHRGWDRGYCKPRRALYKAADMGLRRPELVRAGRNRVVVEGFRHHRPIRVVFANQRHCPVIAVKR